MGDIDWGDYAESCKRTSSMMLENLGIIISVRHSGIKEAIARELRNRPRRDRKKWRTAKRLRRLRRKLLRVQCATWMRYTLAKVREGARG